MTNRLSDLTRFYGILGALTEQYGGLRMLDDCSGRMVWPDRGVYFFFEPSEIRRESGAGPRVVRVGTHALNAGSRSTLWTRISQHKGPAGSGGGNHRGSIFRLLVGTALNVDPRDSVQTWGQGNSAPSDVRLREIALEQQVSQIIRRMSIVCLAVDDEPGRQSLRGFVERNAIALLSNAEREPLDSPSDQWLGRRCDRDDVRVSGLWNQQHVRDECDPAFLDRFEQLVNGWGKNV